MKSTSEIAPSLLAAQAIQASLAGARVARRIQLAGLKPRQKSDDKDDLVTEGDEAAQAAVLELLPPDRKGEPIAILAEEKNAPKKSGAQAGWRWVVDPIDGTLPYSRGEHYWCVSIALQRQVAPGKWESRIGVLYSASPKDTAERLVGKVFWSERGKGAFVYDLATEGTERIIRPATVANRAEISAAGPFGTWAEQEFVSRDIATQFRRSICNATCELLLGTQCAIVQDAGPMEWDVAAVTLIAREAGIHVEAVVVDEVDGCPRYAVVMAWDEALFDVFRKRLPVA